MRNRIYLLAFFAIIFFNSCQKDELTTNETSLPASKYSHRIALTWNQLFLELERFTPGYRPPISARSNGYINLIAYEAIVHGSEGKYKSLAKSYYNIAIDPPKVGESYNWEVALNAAYQRAFELFFPTAPSEQQFLALQIGSDLRSELQSQAPVDIFSRSALYGRYIAETIYDWSAKDQWGHEAYLHNNDPGYIPPSGAGFWQPTYPDYLAPLLPNWGKVRTFAPINSVSAPPPPAYLVNQSSQLYSEANEVMTIVNKIKSGENHDDLWIAQFWSDDCPILTFTPAGRWISIANQIVPIHRPNMMETVALYAKLGMALSDAGVKSWEQKFKYNLMRPIDYIRQNMGNPNWNTLMCPDGSEGYYTPNFPAYPSGHATFAAAASVVLEEFVGPSYRMTDRSHEGRTEFIGKPRTFNSIRDMAIENAHSRIPLGVHFRVDSNVGLNIGYAIGEKVLGLPWN